VLPRPRNVSKNPRIEDAEMRIWNRQIQELVGGLHVIYRISEYINTTVEPFWKTESEVISWGTFIFQTRRERNVIRTINW